MTFPSRLGTDAWRADVARQGEERRAARVEAFPLLVEALEKVLTGRPWSPVTLTLEGLSPELLEELRDVTFPRLEGRRVDSPYSHGGYRFHLVAGPDVTVTLHSHAPGEERASQNANGAVRPVRENH